MKLNKRKCRTFANPDVKFSQNKGVLHASQINYIIRTAIKIIDHHKTLVLYIYPRKQVLKGDYKPCYTVFQTKDDFVTLARKDNGNTTWRKSAFDNLEGDYNFSNKCTFYSAHDAVLVNHYFKNNTDSAFKALISAQDAILARRRQERQCTKEKAIISRMSCIPALPRGLNNWIKSIMPAYFFYDYKRGGKDVPGICSSCGKEIQLSGVKQGSKTICPHCKHELTMKPRSRRGAYMYDRGTFVIIQNTGDDGLVVRILKAYFSYYGDTPDIQIYENARHFVWLDADNKFCTESYYSYSGGILTNWQRGFRTVFSQWQYSFESDMHGYLYTKNLPDTLKNTPWQYCPIEIFYNHIQKPIQIFSFLNSYLAHPRLEHLIKTGFYSIATSLAYDYKIDVLDETKNRTHQILGIAAEDVAFLRELDIDVAMLRIFQKYSGIKDRQMLLLWQIKHGVDFDVMPILGYITAHKMMRYLDSQYEFLCLRKTPHGTIRYDSMKALTTEYRDYLDMCVKLGYDMKNSFVVFPKDLQKSHDKTAKRLKHKTDAKMKRDFIEIYRQLAGQFDFEQNGLKIVYPATPDDVIAEGHALHHCVGGYTDRVAKHECIIVFLRQCCDENKPYYTVEIRDNKAVVQVRGMNNCEMTQEVEEFITAWEQQVLSKLELVA